MKTSLLISFYLILGLTSWAQEVNPFESIGKEGKIITLSKGKYLEFQNNDSLQRIGSVIVNMYSGDIYELLDSDTLYQESDLHPTILTRWYSPDPIFKPHESPYASMANNPILCIDPDGRDSAIANGGNRWMWNVESGDTYNEISKRTGVSLDNLRAWNQYEDTKIPTGAQLNISDPNSPEPSSRADMQTSYGSIRLHILEPNSSPNNGGTVMYVGITFAPNEANKNDTFIWYQTVASNDPIDGKTKEEKKDPNRILTTSMSYKDDQTSGSNNYGQVVGVPLRPHGTVFNPPAGTFPFFDWPNRPYHPTGTINWDGYLQVIKKVNDTWVAVGTIKYGFTATNNVITPTLFEFNPEVNASDADTQYQNQQIKIWDKTH